MIWKRPLPQQLNELLWRILLVGVLLPLIFFILIAVSVGAFAGRQNLTLQRQQLLRVQAYAIETYLTQSGQSLALLRDIINNDEHHTHAELGDHLDDAHTSLSYFDTLYILDSNSRIRQIMPDDPRYYDLDMSQNPYMQLEQAEGLTISSPFHSLRTGVPTIFMVLPLDDGGRIAGELSLHLLQEVVDNSRPADSHEEIFILDHNGTALAAPDPDLVRQQINLNHWPVVQSSLISPDVDGHTDHLHRTEEGLFVASSYPISAVRWVIVSQTPLLTAYAPYLVLATLLSASLVLLYFLLIWNTQRQLQRDLVTPLLQLNQSANAVAKGDFAMGVRPSLILGKVAEIDQLAASFRYMSQSLQGREAALKSSEQHLRLVLKFNEKIVQNMTEGIIIQNSEGVITFINPAITTLLGYQATELIGRNWTMIVPEAEWELVHEADDRRRRDASDRYELHMVRQDGQLVPVMISGSPWYDEDKDKSFAGTISVIMDIATRVKHEQEQNALLRIAELLRMSVSLDEMLTRLLSEIMGIVPATAVAVWLVAEDTEQLQQQVVVPAGARLTMNDSANVSFPLYSQAQYIGEIVMQSAQERPFLSEDVRLLRAIAEMAATAIHRLTLNAQIKQYASELEERVADRTRELSAANARLQELDRLKSKFIANVSHELRTPITNLMLYVELLERGRAEKRDKYRQILHQEVNRLNSLVQSILDISRLHSTHHQTAPASVNLNELVQKAVQNEQLRADAGGLALTFAPQADLPAVDGIATQLEQVVVNLLTNAINYTPSGSVEIRTYTAEAGAMVCLEVNDTGMGIGEADLPHLFDRFYRGQQTASLSQIPGAGLGLAIVKEIVELHQGRIEVHSQLGEGSRFCVLLPTAVGV